MTHILKTLGLAATMLACASTAHAGEWSEQVAFKYFASDSAEQTYKKLKIQARRSCGNLYSRKAERKCANELIDQVLFKIGSSQLLALHDSNKDRKTKPRKYAAKHMAPGFVSIP